MPFILGGISAQIRPVRTELLPTVDPATHTLEPRLDRPAGLAGLDVSMANVMVPFPGASVRDVEQMVAAPAEQVLARSAGFEHVTSLSRAPDRRP